MIKKLRRKFIILSVLSVTAVLVLIMGTVNRLNYQKVLRRADDVLAVLAENNGVFPIASDARDRPEPPPFPSPETPFESRFFSVLLNADGTPVSANTGRIAAVDSETAIDYARLVLNSGRQRGFRGDYRFWQQREGKSVRVIFLDCSRDLSAFRNFLYTSLIISAAGILGVWLLMLIFSNRIIRPISESYEKQKRFITDAGHELKTPLTIIDADAELLGMDLGENEWLSDIRMQTRRLADLTRSLIFLAKLEEQQETLPMFDFPLSDIAAETAQSFQALARARGHRLVIHIQPMLSMTGDQQSIRQLLSILLDNAVRYAGEQSRIELRLARAGRHIRITVQNTTGVPVSSNLLNHLFDRFYRGEASRNSETGGTGIGLSIAAAIVAAHRGKITASAPDPHCLEIGVQLPV